MGKQPEISGDKLTKKNKINDFPIVAGNNKPVTTLQSDQGGNTTSEQKILSNVNTRLDLTPDENLPHYGNEESSGKQSGDIYIEWVKTNSAEEHAKKAQKAAIMARNMSHNLGSHVMAYLKQQMQSSMDIFSSKDHVLHDLNIDGNEYCFLQNQTELPFLVGMGHFINYLQERQDYIATVATSYIPYPTPIDFKEAIVDGINPDLKWKRHRTSGQKPFNILLNYIAKSEGYTREDIVYGDRHDGHYLRINYIDYAINEKDKNETNITEYTPRPKLITGFEANDLETLKGMNAMQIGVPGGTIGRQAVFSIIENITRNAAKHEKNGEKNLDINIGLIDGLKLEKYREKGWISADMFNDYEGCADRSNLYLLCISYHTSIQDEQSKRDLLKMLWKGINEPYVQLRPKDKKEKDKKNDNVEELEFISTNKGIKEVRISASWLRGDLDEDKYRQCSTSHKNNDKLSPLVYIDIHPVENDTNSICYYVGLRKPFKAIIVKDKNYDDASLRIFERISPELRKEMTSENWGTDGANCCYDFVIAQNDDIYNEVRKTSSNRIINWKECVNKFKSVLEQDSLTEEELMNVLYAFHTGIGYQGEDSFTESNVPTIHIWDAETVKYANDNLREPPSVHSNKTYKGVVIKDSDEQTSESTKYIYRTHHDNRAAQYINEKLSPDMFRNIRVEGISGSNSTTRQIRYASCHNFQWYCSNIFALRQNVAIMDERLFDAINGVGDSTLSYINTLNKIYEIVSDYDSFVEKLFEYEADKKHVIYCKFLKDFCSYRDEHKSYNNDYDSLLNSFVDALYNIEMLSIDTGYVHKSAIYAGKGIFIYTICIDENECSIWGIVPKKESNICTYVKIACINRDGSIKSCLSYDLKPQILSEYGSKTFDTISIHQGILDKIYGFVGCKDKEDNNKETKLYITEQIKNFFASDDTCLFIHSGRSKPTTSDMPQQVPFIQYSALENATFDSKHTLIELFENARYEDD